ncbi:hypothetical protein Zmor_012398 [Zophobas morio]|uniref:40S ribosomal protein S25 n=1 Tax=Zophobas morio TaxID=2755281 RepID=A0AA38HG37_9CUCU|nr:hypothetical protein Zmor_012398 [Zophobas morio]
MPPKQQKSKAEKAAAALSGGKGRKKKWSKGKTKDKLNNAVLFNEQTYEKLRKEVPSYKLITAAVVSERLRIRGSLARQAIAQLEKEGLILPVIRHSSLLVYTRNTTAED